MTFITDSDIKSLKNYKYQAQSSSLIEKHILEKIWNYSLSLVPLTVSPNSITVAGLAFSVFSILIISLFDPNFDSPAPRLVYVISALCFFASMTLDAIDGKQARRTGTTSPLGQLFDHVCDSFNATSITISICSALGLGAGIRLIFLIFFSSSVFYVVNWEEAITKTMRFGFPGLSESQLIYISLILVSGIFGTEFYSRAFLGIMLKDYLLLFFVIGASYASAESFHIGLNAANSCNLKKKAKHGIIQLVFYQSLWLRIFTKDSMYLLSVAPVPMITTYGLGFSYIVTRLILSRFTDKSLGLFNPVNVLLLTFTVVSNSGIAGKSLFLVVLFNFATAGYTLYFLVSIVVEIASKLDIDVFGMSRKYKSA